MTSASGSIFMANSVSHADDVAVFLEGELDLAGIDILRLTLERTDIGHRSKVIVDLSALAFCDVTGLNELDGFRRRVEALDGTVRILGATESARRLLEFGGLDHLIDRAPDDVIPS